ncbi:hypothetical protein L7F22_066156 [Adiantum nelumboides]|nr:hypothetical protein [Adiantum nelumboides]
MALGIRFLSIHGFVGAEYLSLSWLGGCLGGPSLNSAPAFAWAYEQAENARDNGGTDVQKSFDKAIPYALTSLKIIVAFFYHFLELLKRRLPIKSDGIHTNGDFSQQIGLPLLGSSCLCKNDPAIYNRVAKLEELVYKMGAATSIPSTNCNCDDTSPARIRTLEVELVETKKTLHAVLSSQSKIQESLRRFEGRKTWRHCW